MFSLFPNEHLDIGYSDYPTKVAEIQSRTIDEAIEMIGKNPDFRYSPDAYWSVEQFMHGRSPEQRQKMFDMVAQRQDLFIPAQFASNVTGFASLEDTIRSLYPSYQFHLQHGGDFDYANITDVPSCTWSYASVLAAAGLKYLLTPATTGAPLSSCLAASMSALLSGGKGLTAAAS